MVKHSISQHAGLIRVICQCQSGEIRARKAADQAGLIAEGLLQQFSRMAQQGVAGRVAMTVVVALEIAQLQQQQSARTELVVTLQQMVHLGIESLPVAQTRHRIDIHVIPQLLGQGGLFSEHLPDPGRHAVHGLHHAPQFPGSWQGFLHRIPMLANGPRLMLHGPQGFQDQPQQQRARQGAQRHADQEPQQIAPGAAPQFGIGIPRMTGHPQGAGLVPARHHLGLGGGRFQRNQPDEPGRHPVDARRARALVDRLARRVVHPDQPVIASVVHGIHHRLHGGQILAGQMRRQRQAQRGGGVLGRRRQLLGQIGAGAVQADAEGAQKDQQKQETQRQIELFVERHAVPTGRKKRVVIEAARSGA